MFSGLYAAQAAPLVDMQWRAQVAGHSSSFPDAVDHVVQVDGTPVGRLLVHRGGDRTIVVDLAVLPAHQGRGIATAVLGTVIEEAAATDRRVALTVARDNLRAIDLYRRLGFVGNGDGTDTDLSLQLDPAA